MSYDLATRVHLRRLGFSPKQVAALEAASSGGGGGITIPDVQTAINNGDITLPGGGGGGGSADPTVAGASRVADTMFTLPDATKDYYVDYRADYSALSSTTLTAYYGDPDGAGWFTSHSLLDLFDDGATGSGVHKVELKGKVPAGKSVLIVTNQGPSAVSFAAIETPLS